MKKKIMIIEESLYEFAKRGRPKKSNKTPLEKMRGIDTSDSWKDDEEIEDEEIEDVNIDVSDMADVDTIDMEKNVFNDELETILSNELKMLEINRRTLTFRLKGNTEKIFNGVPMTKIGDNAFVFKLDDGKMKKILLSDIILEQEKRKGGRALTINE
jgi:hypothetical protein